MSSEFGTPYTKMTVIRYVQSGDEKDLRNALESIAIALDNITREFYEYRLQNEKEKLENV